MLSTDEACGVGAYCLAVMRVLMLSTDEACGVGAYCLTLMRVLMLSTDGTCGVDAYCLAVMRVLKLSTDGAYAAAASRWLHSLVVRTKNEFFKGSAQNLNPECLGLVSYVVSRGRHW